MSLDGVPYIGRYSAMTPNLYVASGFNKWGMTTSMVAAQLLTDIITGKKSPYEAVFSPSRSMLHAQLGVNAVEAGKNLLTVSPRRCSHLGCALKWNPQERLPVPRFPVRGKRQTHRQSRHEKSPQPLSGFCIFYDFPLVFFGMCGYNSRR